MQNGLVGHWLLGQDTGDHSPCRHPTRNTDVELGAIGPGGKPGTAARFNGAGAMLEAADHAALRFGTGDLSIALWVNTEDMQCDVLGDLVSKFDPATRKGFQLYLLTNAGVTSTALANHRNLQFGIDNARMDAAWQDHGRPGNAVHITALAVCQGQLYAGTLEKGANEMGRLWRFNGPGQWQDLGNPAGCNAIHALTEFEGALYCGTGRYNCHGSLLGETLNTIPGGKVFRVEPGGKWIECGHPGREGATPENSRGGHWETGKADDVIALTVCRGSLYAVSHHRRGVFKYLGGQEWQSLGLDRRVMTLAVYRNKLHALINGDGFVYRHEGGENWISCGRPGTSTQTYSAVIYQGGLYVGTWPEGEVYRYEGGENWKLVSRVGYAREIMAMALYNGKVYAGSLPMANVWRMDGERFTFLANLDNTPVPLRRVWSMAVFQGKLFAGTLPAGHVWSLEAGKMATWDKVFPGGWHHVAAVKDRRKLRLYMDGRQVAESTEFARNDFDLGNEQPLRIGSGNHAQFKGLLSDARLYNRALAAGEIAALALRQAVK